MAKKPRIVNPVTFLVRLPDGTLQQHEATFAFDNGENGLVIRARYEGREHTEIVAHYARGHWASYVRAEGFKVTHKNGE